ncbi:MAG: HEAT repeat domain-containing protein [Acidobacteriota bacterium]
MSSRPEVQQGHTSVAPPPEDEKSDLRVVLQFFVVPMSLVAVLVVVFFGLQMLRSRRPDPAAALDSLRHYEGFLARIVGDLKRWQYGYDLSVLLRGEDADSIRRMVPQIAEGFREAGRRDDPELRRYLTLALGLSADPQAVGPLWEGLRDDDPQTRLYATWGLARVGGAAVLPALRAAARDADAGVRKMAVFALGQLGDRGARGVLRAALQDAEADVRWNAALSLARLGDEAAVPVLLMLLEDSLEPPPEGEDPAGAAGRSERAVNAIRGLAILRPPEAVGLLRRAADLEDDRRVAEAGSLALEAYVAETTDIP